MRLTGLSRRRAVPLLLLTAALLTALQVAAQVAEPAQPKSPAPPAQLGRVEFPTSGPAHAQAHFLRGVAAMHSFWYEEALEAFRAATEADPTFAMGYWGEAMAHNHPIWGQQDAEAGRRALSKITSTDRLTPRERAFIAAARVLYGEGDKHARDLAYAAAMEQVARDFPDDLEAAAFYSLALLGTVRPGEKGFQRQMRAGAAALEVYGKNPLHPGAAHYVIHAFDDPEHAILALPAARRYAEIAPAAHHARHMPAHIFLQLGMWAEAAASNESAWAVSDEWVRRKNLPLGLRDYHSRHWLIYVYAQQGRYAEAEKLIADLRRTMREHGRESVRWYDDAAAALIVDAERWGDAAKLFEPPASQATSAKSGSGEQARHHQHGAAQPAATTVPGSRRGMLLPLFVRALAAAQTAAPDADRLLGELRAAREQRGAGDAYGAKVMEIRELEVAGALAAARKNFDEAVALMKRAAALEEEMSPPSGPPTLIKPAQELCGEILLRAGRAQEAAAQFTAALARQPNRARSLLGAARAAARGGDRRGATEAYTSLLRVWRQADADLPELREARDYVGQAGGR
jgi:tetratricopeptide (TPR) repeat protein